MFGFFVCFFFHSIKNSLCSRLKRPKSEEKFSTDYFASAMFLTFYIKIDHCVLFSIPDWWKNAIDTRFQSNGLQWCKFQILLAITVYGFTCALKLLYCYLKCLPFFKLQLLFILTKYHDNYLGTNGRTTHIYKCVWGWGWGYILYACQKKIII